MPIKATNVTALPSSYNGAPLDNGGGPPHDGNMEPRIAKLEEFAADAKERLVKIETRLDHTATKADVHESANKVIIWVAATAVSLGATAIVVMTFVLNNAVPKAPSAAPAPIIIYAQPAQVPAATPAPVAPAPSK